MSALEEYIETVKQKTEGLSELETVRYVYLDLGKRMKFDLKYSFGNVNNRKEIYKKSASKDAIEQGMEDNIIICKSLAIILKRVLTELGIQIDLKIEEQYGNRPAHVYNIVTPKDGEKYSIDLQSDLQNIQSGARTKWFGLAVKRGWKKDVAIGQARLEKIDKKLGYISESHYYSDDYIEFMKYMTRGMKLEDIAEKAQIILENIDIYPNEEMSYAERKAYHEGIIFSVFNADEYARIKMIDCYSEQNGEKEYKTCVIVNKPHGEEADVYMYSNEQGRYCKSSMEELAKMVQSGLVCVQKVYQLNNFLKTQKSQEGNGQR